MIGFEDSFTLLDCLLNRDTEGVIKLVSKLNSQGVDFRICVQDFRRFMLNAVKAALGIDSSLILMPENEVAHLRAYPKDPRLFVILARVSDLVGKMTYDADPFTLMTAEFVRMVGEI